MNYQGHHSDGSSIQCHSAGSHYPFVVGNREHPFMKWFVMAPDGTETTFANGDDAYAFAQSCADIRNARIAYQRGVAK